MANDALQQNPDLYSQLGITTRGSDWLWAVFAVMLVTDLVVIGWHFTIPRGQRLFHQLSIIILTTATIAYFSMASNLGSTPIATEFAYGGYPAGVLRQVWYVRYIDWVITTPALLLELCLASGLPLSDIITLIFFDLVMIITGLVGALVVSSYKWAYFVFGDLALFYIWWALAGPARTSAGALGPAFQRSFTSSAIMLSFLWLLYPIAWGLADGASVIHPDGEMIFYGILDVLAKPVFILYHLWSLSKLDLAALQLTSGKFTDSAHAVSHFDREKQVRAIDNPTPVGIHQAGNNFANSHATANTSGGKEKKNGMFSRKGKYDVTNTNNGAHGVNAAAPIVDPVGPFPAETINHRHSEATVASR